MKVYLDYASTTPLLPEVIETMKEVMAQHYGNPSSIHSFGRKAKSLVEESRKTIANSINASLGEVFFTAGATESNNMIMHAAVRDLGVKRIVSSNIEHHCILHTLEAIKAQHDVEVILLEANEKGQVSLDELEYHLKDGAKALVSIMHANNEIGTMIEIDRVAEICDAYGAYFHSDIAQTYGKYNFDMQSLKMSFLSASAHKLYGPKGTGFIYINEDIDVQPLLHGGGQERNMRSGTENVIGISGFAKAADLAYAELESRHRKVTEMRNYLETQILELIPGARINGDRNLPHLYNIASISFPHSDKAELLVFNLDIAGICISSGSACASGAEQDSHVLAAIGHESERKTIRFSLSHLTTMEELDYVLSKLKTIC